MRREVLKKLGKDLLIENILKQEELIKQRDCDLEEASAKMKSLIGENESLRQQIEKMKYEKLPFLDDEIDYDTLISELQDQHQQDCIRFNDMRTAYLTTVDELARLREQVGI